MLFLAPSLTRWKVQRSSRFSRKLPSTGMTMKGPIMGEIDLSTHICSDSKGELVKPDGPSKQQAQIFMTRQLCFFYKLCHSENASTLAEPPAFVYSCSLWTHRAASWDLERGRPFCCCWLRLWQVVLLPEWSSTGCFLPFFSPPTPNRHLSSCGILMTRSTKAICLQDRDTMASVPPSRNFISFTNKRKEYSERRILG